MGSISDPNLDESARESRKGTRPMRRRACSLACCCSWSPPPLSPPAREPARSDVKLGLVAYSTPARRTARSSRSSRRRRRGRGSASPSRTARRVTRHGPFSAGLKADIVALSLAPDVDAARQGRPRRRRTGTSSRTRGSSPTRSSCSSVRDGNPKHIKTWNDLLKPGRLGDHAEPVHVGWRPLERDGRLRRVASSRARRRSRRRRTC